MHPARSSYRTLLRLVDKYITNVNNSPLWREYVQSQFRAHRDAQPEQAAALLHAAQLYAKFLHDVHYHKVRLVSANGMTHIAHTLTPKDLLVSYNISVDAQKRKREHLANVANKVGLQMPQGFEETTAHQQ